MKKRIALSVDEDVYEQLKFVPRGFSVSDFVGFMLRGMLQEVKGKIPTQEDFDKWVDSDPELKKVREGIREAWGPTLNPVIEKIDTVSDGLKASVGIKKKSSKDQRKK